MTVSVNVISLIGLRDSAIIYDSSGPLDGAELIEKRAGDNDPETAETTSYFAFVEVKTDDTMGERMFQFSWSKNTRHRMTWLVQPHCQAAMSASLKT